MVAKSIHSLLLSGFKIYVTILPTTKKISLINEKNDLKLSKKKTFKKKLLVFEIASVLRQGSSNMHIVHV